MTQLAEIQAKMLTIESRFLALNVFDVLELDSALIIIENYLKEIKNLENLILNKKVALLEKKVNSLVDTQQTN